jgi:hypothetical protein
MEKSELDIFTSDGRINPDKAFALVQKKMLEMTPEQFIEINSKPFEMTGVNRAVVRKVAAPGNPSPKKRSNKKAAPGQ